ncbi:MAG: efflux RND transporter periplasmic adaptor subunit [Candidatus Beckwithbacteria bacterium]|nr:efflux RND transporter periplasmic adaptor subunit [Candidatus Beckwithbacteria bacterium]
MIILTWLKQHRWQTGLIIIVLFGSGWLSYQKFWPKAPETLYDLVPAAFQDIRQTVTASGKVKSATEVNLQFQTAGQLAWVGVKEGDYVNKWQALASLDQKQLKKTLQKYLLDFSKERNDFDEALKVTYRDTALTDTISRILQKNQYDLDKAVLDVELQDITLKYATLITPISGIVTHIDTPVSGVNIIPAAAVFTVADPQNLVFEAQIDEMDISLVKVQQAAEITLDAYPDKPIPVTVDSIDFNSQADSSGSTVFIAKFKLVNSIDQSLLLGMNGEVSILVNAKNNVLSVPTAAINETNGQTQVQIVVNHRLKSLTVITGTSNGDLTEITSGLNPEQIVVIGKKLKK